MIKNRIFDLQEALTDNQAFLITSDSNRFYLTGFKSSAGTVLITKTKALFFVDFRYFEKAKSTVCSCNVCLADKGLADVAVICKEQKIKSLFIETNHTSIGEYNRYVKLFENTVISKENMLDTKLNKMRAVKSKDELEFIKQAQDLTEQTFDYILPRITSGRTEREIMLDMEFFMRRLGADAVAFDFIVVSGKNSSLPHGVPTDKKIKKGDFVTMDFGAKVGGYCSDMTRTVAIESISEKQAKVYETVLKAQLSAMENIKFGAACRDIDKLARDIIYSAGYEGCFGHSLGHSVGIDIHENPTLSPNSTVNLESGNVVTVEPGIYIENEFGVRIEDMVYVTQDGYLNLTKANKELIIL